MSNERKSPRLRGRSATWSLLAALALGACGEESTAPEPPELELPDDPDPTYGEGRWAVSQRGVAIDEEDDPVIQRGPGGGGGIGTERIQAQFGLLVLNRPYIDNRFAECTDAGEAADKRPFARSGDIVDVLAAKGLNFDAVAVNVDLLSPSRTTLIYQCFQRGNALPRFGTPEHRESVKQAFAELARLPKLKYVTVGLDLNRYYHLRLEGGASLTNDYANLVTLYREVYAAIKEANPNVKVGPGISWPTFRGTTVREIANEYGLSPEADTLEAVHRAYLRTVEPLLVEGSGAQRKPTADFLGVTVVPSPAESPYGGNPAPEAEDDRQRVFDFYRHLPLVSGGLPVAFPQLDWPIRSDGLAVQKKAFLELFQQATSHVDVEFVAWRRLSDLTRTEGSNKCTAYTGGPIEQLRHPEDYCYAGLINESGAVRDVLDVLTTDPSATPAAE